MGPMPLYLVVLSSLPRLVFPIYEDQRIDGPLDPEWSQYIEEMKPPNFDFEKLSVPKPQGKATPLHGWSPIGYGEAPYVAVIFKPSQDFLSASLTQGSACGAALITSNKVITVCACLASWIVWIHEGHTGSISNINKRYKSTPWDIKSDQIYVRHSQIEFTPKFDCVLNKEVKQFDYQTICYKAVTEERKEIAQQAAVVIVEFFPKIKHVYPGLFIPWPPQPILPDAPSNISAEIITFGMESHRPDLKFFDDSGDDIKIEYTAVDFGVVKTTNLDCANTYGVLPGEYMRNVTCFLPRVEREVCGGLVGSPVVLSGGIHGLLTTPVSCGTVKGEALTVDFTDVIRILVERVAGGEKLVEQNTVRPPLWREEHAPKFFVNYEEPYLPTDDQQQRPGLSVSPTTPFIPSTPLIAASLFMVLAKFAISRSK